MLTVVRRYWPFLFFAAVAVTHVVQLAFGAESLLTKPILMPALLIGVLVTVLVTARAEIPIETALVALGLLEVAILAFWLTDLIFARPPEVAGIAASGAAHLFLIVLFVGPLRARWRSWLFVPYAVVLVVVVATLLPGLGTLAPVIVTYSTVIVTMAYLAARVSLLTGIGAGLFVVSAILKGILLFYPSAISAIPLSAVDAVIMALYCAGIGLVALGSVRRLEVLAADAVPARRRTVAPPWARAERVAPATMR